MIPDTRLPRLHNESVAEYLIASGLLDDDVTITIDHSDQKGQIILRDRSIWAAQYDRLKGNGAAMILTGWKGAELTLSSAVKKTKRNVSLNLEHIQQLQQRSPSASNIHLDNSKFRKSIHHIYSFQYKEAVTDLIELLKANRYDYTAWLWYSRLIGKVKTVESALSEAQKWGNSDEDIWNEMKKLQPLIVADCEEVKRCYFCWAPMVSGNEVCPHCHGAQSVQTAPDQEKLQEIEIKRSLQRYHKILQTGQENPKLAYILALGMYNLGLLKRACHYQEIAVKAGTGNEFYSQILAVLKQKCLDLGLLEKENDISSSSQSTSPRGTTSVPAAKAKLSPNGKTILVVEDSKTSQKVINMVLNREGLQTIPATTGEEAIELAGSHTPELILLDVMLPDMTGYDVLIQLKQKNLLSDIPVIMLTGKRGAEDRIKGLQAGSSEYLTKPFDPQKLTSIIKKYL